MPELDHRRIRFEFVIQQYLDQPTKTQLSLPKKVRLSWYRHSKHKLPEIQLGEQWRFQVRLKPPVGFMNPGGFDYEAWLFSQNIRATGYVRKHVDNQLVMPVSEFSFKSLRVSLLNKMLQLTDGLRSQGVLLALALGYRNEISDSDWDLLLKTGTNHLVAISGLHIGMIAAVFYWLGLRGIWCIRFLRIPYPWPQQMVAAMIAWCAALTYAWLAGFALPTQRALMMLSVGLLGLMLYRQLRPGQALGLALLLVLIVDPFAVNQASFWLSFGAVAVLLYCFAGRQSRRPQRQQLILTWGKVQGWLLVGLSPLTVYWFGGAAALASLANLIAIPLIGFIVVPLTLLAMLLSGFWSVAASFLINLADQSLNLLWPVLTTMSAWPLARWEQTLPPSWAVLLAMVGVVLLLAPRGLPGRWVGFFWLMPMLLYVPTRPAEGDFDLTVLDVGQGTAVILRTATHNLLYDAGPSSGAQFDSGRMVIQPFMKQQNIQQLDMMVISHGDNDHIGGAKTILEAIPVTAIITSVPDQLASFQAVACHNQQRWHWDGVDFEIIHPRKQQTWQGNDGSCVLQISNGQSRVLLTGDIEKPAERTLLAAYPLQPVNLLLVPHHGSRTSSIKTFLKVLQPEHAVFTAGLFNRYGFPKPDVVQRYRDRGSQIWVSGQQGALTFTATDKGLRFKQAYRSSAQRYWHYRPALTAN